MSLGVARAELDALIRRVGSLEGRAGGRVEVLRPGWIPSQGAVVRRFRLKSVAADHLVCREWNGTDEGSVDVLVAKSYLLRRTPFDGETRNGVTYTYSDHVTRIADNGAAVIVETVVPVYVADDEIWATRNPIGGTGVTLAPEWLDDNRDGRAWAEVEE